MASHCMSKVVVIGAGMGGLTAALLLANAGLNVTVLERAATPGGKLSTAQVNGATIDVGPTVFTMRWVFEGIFAAIGERLQDSITLTPLSTLARHSWSATERLDLFVRTQSEFTMHWKRRSFVRRTRALDTWSPPCCRRVRLTFGPSPRSAVYGAR